VKHHLEIYQLIGVDFDLLRIRSSEKGGCGGALLFLRWRVVGAVEIFKKTKVRWPDIGSRAWERFIETVFYVRIQRVSVYSSE